MKRILYLCLIAVFAASCQKEQTQIDNSNTEWGTFKVDQKFNWLTSNVVSVQYSGNSTLEIFDANMAYIASVTSNNIKGLHIPTSTTKLYVFETNSNLGTWIEVSAVLNLNALKFEASQPSNKVGRESNVRNAACSSCTRTISTGNNLNITIAANEKVCITGNLSGTTNITVSGKSELSICSTVKIGNLNINTGDDFVFTIGNSGSVAFSSLNINSTKHVVYNYGTMTLNQGIGLNTSFFNFGTIDAKSNFNINTSGRLTNNANAIVNCSSNLSNNGQIINSGKILVATTFDLNSSGNLVNECQLTVGGNLNINKNFTNSGQITSGARYTQNSGCTIVTSYANSSISSRDMSINGPSEFYVVDGKAAIEVTNNTVINGRINVTNGLLDFCDKNGIETGAANIAASNVSNCKVYLTANACRTTVVGTPQFADADNDGVEDALDVEPNNSQVAFYSYAPNANTWSKFMSEDLWPYQGDYDFNDVVYRYRIQYSENASGKVVSAKISGFMDCVSGGIHSGFAFRFLNGETGLPSNFNSNIIASIAAVKPNTYASSAMRNTVVMADDIYKLQTRYYSNDGTGPSGPSEMFEVTVNFQNSNLTAANLLVDNFIFHTNEPGVEIHTANYPPTERANMSLIGTGQDASNAANNKYYVNKNNYPWAMIIYQDTQVRHAKSKIKITDAFPQIVDWIKSGGRLNTNWYENADSQFAFIQ